MNTCPKPQSESTWARTPVSRMQEALFSISLSLGDPLLSRVLSHNFAGFLLPYQGESQYESFTHIFAQSSKDRLLARSWWYL